MLKLLKAKWSEFKQNPFLWLVAWWLILAIGMSIYKHGSVVW